MPAYVDRPQIMVRAGPNEVIAMDNERWAEDLSANMARTVAEDLSRLLPAGEVTTLPRSAAAIDYAVRVDLSRFDIDEDGNTAIGGRWSITDLSGRERASGRISRMERASASFAAIAAAISHELLAVSTEIAAAIAALPAPARSPG